MAYSKVRWISTPAFLACIGGAHGRGEGANVHKEAQTVELGARMAVCAPPLVYAPTTTPTIQRDSNVAATVNKISLDLSYARSTRRWPLSDVTDRQDGRTHAQTTLVFFNLISKIEPLRHLCQSFNKLENKHIRWFGLQYLHTLY
jgi:hypothetical protein